MRRRKDRYEAGRALRVKCPRDAHSEYKINWRERPESVQLLIESSVGRIEELLPIRYGRMLASPFAFFRGAAVVMTADLAQTPSTGYAVQACGDCHLMNFGAFATPERNIVFDINDFDETFPAPWEWDLKRLAASFVIASRHNGHKRGDSRTAAARLVQSYRDKMHELAEMSALGAWYSFLDYETLIEMGQDETLKKRRKKVLNKAISRDSMSEFVRMAHVLEGQPRIKDCPPLIFHRDEATDPGHQDRIRTALERYRLSLPRETRVLLDRYELVDNAMKVVGVGSVGTYCAIGLFFAAEGDPLFLQVKEARQSVIEPYVNYSWEQTHGERVVFGQRLMQSASDIFLGHCVSDLGKHFYVRQMRDVKVKPLVEIFTPQNMQGFARSCGWALALAHARSGDPAVIAGYIGKGDVFPDAVAQFADAYYEQNLTDHASLLGAIRDGVIDAYSESE
ncbi:MAG: DUF2252 family protein [Cyanobacteria bacterium REEB67]|nr:DUF2252 family protein [Cyanobacteria bacterium REEB67]